MLTLLYPNLLQSILEFPGGLLTGRDKETKKLLLIIKAPKEYILAAKFNSGFSFYLAPLPSTSGLTVALATAFFDDEDEPLVIRTPLFDEPLAKELLELLTYHEFDVYFFDEHGREWMGCRTSVLDKNSLIARREKFGLLTYHPQTMNSVYDNLETWFGCRTAEDDANSIKVKFKEELFPSDLYIIDAREEKYDYFGSEGFSGSSLERETPGYFQERDIVAGLKRAFYGEQIVLNPMRRDNGKEFVDVLAFNKSHLLLIQAKDSPNTAASLTRSIDRKRRTSNSQIKKGVGQAKGAAKYVSKHPTLELYIDEFDIDIDVQDKRIINLVVVQEMFVDEGDVLFAWYRKMEDTLGMFLMLEYTAFDAFCHKFPEEQQLLDAFEDYSSKIFAKGLWIDPRAYLSEFI